jgi:hypothetical protein
LDNGEKDDWPLDNAELMSGSGEPGKADAAAVGDPKPPPENAEPNDPGNDEVADAGDPIPPPLDSADPSDPGSDAACEPMPPPDDPEDPPPGEAGLKGNAPAGATICVDAESPIPADLAASALPGSLRSTSWPGAQVWSPMWSPPAPSLTSGLLSVPPFGDGSPTSLWSPRLGAGFFWPEWSWWSVRLSSA